MDNLRNERFSLSFVEGDERLALVKDDHFVKGYLKKNQVLDIDMHAFSFNTSEGPLHLFKVDLVDSACLQDHSFS